MRLAFGHVSEQTVARISAAKLELIETWFENILLVNTEDDVFG
jgi:hypothetical protein